MLIKNNFFILIEKIEAITHDQGPFGPLKTWTFSYYVSREIFRENKFTKIFDNVDMIDVGHET